jgi:hypothetical protein
MAFFAFGGLVGILLLSSALKSSSLSGETLVLMFLPSIPLAIMANVPVELLVFPVLLIIGWREGTRRTLIVVAAALYSSTASGPTWSSRPTDWISLKRRDQLHR